MTDLRREDVAELTATVRALSQIIKRHEADHERVRDKIWLASPSLVEQMKDAENAYNALNETVTALRQSVEKYAKEQAEYKPMFLAWRSQQQTKTELWRGALKQVVTVGVTALLAAGAALLGYVKVSGGL